MKNLKLLLVAIPFVFACAKTSVELWSADELKSTTDQCATEAQSRLTDPAQAQPICSCWVQSTSQKYSPAQVDSEDKAIQTDIENLFKSCATKYGETIQMIRFTFHRNPAAAKPVRKGFGNALKKFKQKNPAREHTPAVETPPAEAPVEAPVDAATPEARPVADKPVERRKVEFDLTDNTIDLTMKGLQPKADQPNLLESNGVERKATFSGNEVACSTTVSEDFVTKKKVEILTISGENADGTKFVISVKPFDRTNAVYAQGDVAFGEEDKLSAMVSYKKDGKSEINLVNSHSQREETLQSRMDVSDLKVVDGKLSAKFSLKKLGGIDESKANDDRTKLTYGDVEGSLSCTLEDFANLPVNLSVKKVDRGEEARDKKNSEPAPAPKNEEQLKAE